MTNEFCHWSLRRKTDEEIIRFDNVLSNFLAKHLKNPDNFFLRLFILLF
jgi:hypothetical protein